MKSEHFVQEMDVCTIHWRQSETFHLLYDICVNMTYFSRLLYRQFQTPWEETMLNYLFVSYFAMKTEHFIKKNIEYKVFADQKPILIRMAFVLMIQYIWSRIYIENYLYFTLFILNIVFVFVDSVVY